MRSIPGPGENLVGKVCVCSLGRVGVVVEFKEITFANGDKTSLWCGMGFDGKGLWASRDPVILAETLKEYTDRILSRPSNVLYGNIAVQPPKKG
jgi:hypothetical protein